MFLIILNLSFHIYTSSEINKQINGRMEIYDKSSNLSNSIVFLNTYSGSMVREELTRNGIDFKNNPVLYVMNKGNESNLIVRQYPKRDYYLWDCEKLQIEENQFIDIINSESKNCELIKLK